MTDALLAKGVLLQIEDATTPGSWATLGGLLDVTPPDEKDDIVDTTAHDTAGHFHEKTPVLTDAGSAMATFKWQPEDPLQDQSTGLIYIKANRIKRHYRLVYPSNRHVAQDFYAFVRSFKPETKVTDIMKASVEFLLAGGSAWNFLDA